MRNQIDKKKLVIFGLGETADVAHEYFTHDSEYEVVAFTADESFIKQSSFKNLPVVPFEDVDTLFPPDDYVLFVAATYNKLNRVRRTMFDKAKGKGYNLASYISSSAFVWHNVRIGENAMILENNVIQTNVVIGDNVILWSGNHIGHRTVIEEDVYISSHCVISGFCLLGKRSFLGVNCTFNDEITLGEDNVVGSGALIVRDSQPNQLLIGAPAKPADKTAKVAFGVEHG